MKVINTFDSNRAVFGVHSLAPYYRCSGHLYRMNEFIFVLLTKETKTGCVQGLRLFRFESYFKYDLNHRFPSSYSNVGKLLSLLASDSLAIK